MRGKILSALINSLNQMLKKENYLKELLNVSLADLQFNDLQQCPDLVEINV